MNEIRDKQLGKEGEMERIRLYSEIRKDEVFKSLLFIFKRNYWTLVIPDSKERERDCVCVYVRKAVESH
jgi:hypothetical protein